MSIQKSQHKVYMFTNDYNAMCAEVYLHQHIETGGNLFGLWTPSGDAIIHVALGPGQNCKRTSTSFHQDLKYMERVGRFVNDNYMLCHIGEWHSHHNLSLSQPSAGDESTIRQNFPQGVSKFLVIIANIENGDTIKLSPYFFTDGGTRYEIAKYVVLKPDSPFSTDEYIWPQTNLEKEQKSDSILEADHSAGSNSRRGGNTNPTRFQANQSSSHGPSASAPKSKPPPSDVLGNLTQSKLGPGQTSSLVGLSISAPKPRPRPSDALVNLTQSKLEPNKSSSVSLGNQSEPSANRIDSSNTQVTPTTPPPNPGLGKPHSSHTRAGSSRFDPRDNPGRPIPGADDGIRYPPRDYNLPASQHATAAEGQGGPKKKMNVDEETPSKPEIKKIHDHLKYWYGCQPESMFKFENFMKSRNTLEISFKHNKNFWVVCFPKEFPDEPAELFCSVYQHNVRVTKVPRIDIVGPLDNVINILMSIKSRCGSISGRCNACRNFTRESLPKFIQNIGSSCKLLNSASELVKDIEKSLTGVNDLAMKCGSESQAQITFKYKTRYWVIELPANYPEIAAKVYYFTFEGSSQKCDVILHGEDSYGRRNLNTSELIIKAISTQ